MTSASFDGSQRGGFVTLDGSPPGGDGGIGDIVVVSDKTDLPAPVGGVITINSTYLLDKIVTLDPGVRLVFGESGVIIGLSSADAGFIGDYDGPLISGPVVIREISVENQNLGASAADFNIFSSLGRTVRMEYLSIRGTRAGTIANCLGAVTMDSCFLNGAGEGFIIDGVIGAFQIVNCSTGNTPPGFIGFDVLGTCTVVQAISWRSCNFLTTDASDRGIRISESATLPTGPTPTTILGCLITACFRTGPGQTLEQGPGFFNVSDPEIWSIANANLRNSNIHAFTYFFNETTPATMTYTGVGTWDVIPSDNSPSGISSLILDPSSERYSLVINSRQDWYLQYEGTQIGVHNTLAWAVDVSSATSNNDLEFRVTQQIAGAGAWLDIPNSHGLVQQVNRKQAIQGVGIVTMNPGDRFRLEVRPVGTTNDSEYYRIQLRSFF